MKRYLLFAGDYDWCDTFGGWHDFKGSYDTLEDAQRDWDGADWAHIVDSTTGEVVAEYNW